MMRRYKSFRKVIDEYLSIDGIEIIVIERPSYSDSYIYHFILSQYKAGIEICHRIDGPSYIHHSSVILLERWHINGFRHRIDGPAETDYYNDGSKHIESWYINGKRHNLYQPSVISYDHSGRVSSYTWFRDGDECTSEINSLICSMGLPMDWRDWSNEEKLLFKLSIDG